MRYLRESIEQAGDSQLKCLNDVGAKMFSILIQNGQKDSSFNEQVDDGYRVKEIKQKLLSPKYKDIYWFYSKQNICLKELK